MLADAAPGAAAEGPERALRLTLPSTNARPALAACSKGAREELGLTHP